MIPSVLQHYLASTAAGQLEADAAQAKLAARLDALSNALGDAHGPGIANGLARLFGAKSAPSPRGLYIYGAVGRGKTLLMDLFFACAPLAAKQRWHFHAFMAETHARLHQWRQGAKRGGVNGLDPIAALAQRIASEARLLCFDEFSVRDIADAMILGRLFTALFAAGVVVVTTSNVAPDDLYKDGLNRALFLPFIADLKDHLEVVALDASTDYRLEKLRRAPVFYCPDDAAATAALDNGFRALTGMDRGAPIALPNLGRALSVPQAAGGVARFSFDDLCGQPLASSDYLVIARNFHTVIIDHIPVIRAPERNAAKRFINLIDALYELKVKLLASMAAPPDRLFEAANTSEGFEFTRTASRLAEMQSADYLALAHGHSGLSASADLGGLVET